MGLFSSKSSSVVQTTQQNYDNRQAVGDDSIGLAAGANFSLVNELPDNAVNLLSNFATQIAEVAKEGTRGAAQIATQTTSGVQDLVKQVRTSTAAVDLQTLAPYLVAGAGILALVFIFRKG